MQSSLSEHHGGDQNDAIGDIGQDETNCNIQECTEMPAFSKLSTLKGGFKKKSS